MGTDDKVKTGEIVQVPTQHPEPRSLTLFGTDDPARVIEVAGRVATALGGVIEQQGLFTDIGGRKHVRVEGWTLCGSMLGVFPVCVWTKAIEGGFEARVEARLRDGTVVGAAEAQCTTAEPRWKTRDAYAIRSMAQTRATSKAMRLPLGFIVAMCGYETTPEEEMVHDAHPAPKAATKPAPAAKKTEAPPKEDQKEPPPPANAPVDAADDAEGKIIAAQVLRLAKTKTSTGKFKYGINMKRLEGGDGTAGWVNTFDEAMFKQAEEAKNANRVAWITMEHNAKYKSWDLTSIMLGEAIHAG